MKSLRPLGKHSGKDIRVLDRLKGKASKQPVPTRTITFIIKIGDMVLSKRKLEFPEDEIAMLAVPTKKQKVACKNNNVVVRSSNSDDPAHSEDKVAKVAEPMKKQKVTCKKNDVVVRNSNSDDPVRSEDKVAKVAEPMKKQKVACKKTNVVVRNSNSDDPVRSEDKVAKVAEPTKKQKVSCNNDIAVVKSSNSDDSARGKVRQILGDAMSKVAEEAKGLNAYHQVNACNPNDAAKVIESVLFQKLGPFQGANRLKYRSIIFNMRDPSNPDLRRKVLVGEVNGDMLVTMTPEEMASNERQQENEKIRNRKH